MNASGILLLLTLSPCGRGWRLVSGANKEPGEGSVPHESPDPSPALASLGHPLPQGESERKRASQTPRDQQLHDLVGAGIDAQHPCVAVEARDRVFVHIAIAAEHL